MTTKKGRVVYTRKFHDFTWTDALRVVMHGLGMPAYVDQYMATRSGLPKYKIDVSPVAAREFVCLMLLLDSVGSIVANMPKGAADGPTLTTAFSFMKPADQKKYARVKEIQMGRLIDGLTQVAGAVGSTEGL